MDQLRGNPLFIRHLRLVIAPWLMAIVFLCTGAAPTMAAGGAWPVRLNTEDLTIKIFQPRLDSKQDNQLLARATVSFSTAGVAPVFAVMTFSGRIQDQASSEHLTADHLTLIEVRYGAGAGQEAARLNRLLLSRFETLQLDIAPQDAAIESSMTQPPARLHIIWSKEPAILVPIEGQPDLRDIPGTRLKAVINAMLPIIGFADHFYLMISDQIIYESQNLFSSWQIAAQVPADVQAQFNIQIDDQQPRIFNDPVHIIIATEPTALLVSEGPPAWVPMAESSLLYMSNTLDDIFLDPSTRSHYVRLEDTWYRGSLTKGQWTQIPDLELPLSVARINTDLPAEQSYQAEQSYKAAQESTYYPVNANNPLEAIPTWIFLSADGPNYDVSRRPYFYRGFYGLQHQFLNRSQHYERRHRQKRSYVKQDRHQVIRGIRSDVSAPLAVQPDRGDRREPTSPVIRSSGPRVSGSGYSPGRNSQTPVRHVPAIGQGQQATPQAIMAKSRKPAESKHLSRSRRANTSGERIP